MIHLSVAIGRFVEALLWAIARVAGQITGVVVGIAFAGLLVFVTARWMLARGRR